MLFTHKKSVYSCNKPISVRTYFICHSIYPTSNRRFRVVARFYPLHLSWDLFSFLPDNAYFLLLSKTWRISTEGADHTSLKRKKKCIRKREWKIFRLSLPIFATIVGIASVLWECCCCRKYFFLSLTIFERMNNKSVSETS